MGGNTPGRGAYNCTRGGLLEKGLLCGDSPSLQGWLRRILVCCHVKADVIINHVAGQAEGQRMPVIGNDQAYNRIMCQIKDPPRIMRQIPVFIFLIDPADIRKH